MVQLPLYPVDSDRSPRLIVGQSRIGPSSPGARRGLVVCGRRRLDDAVGSALRDRGWQLHLCQTLDEASALCERQEILAGLALLPSPLTDAGVHEVRCMIEGLPSVEWVAAFPREALDRADVRRLIVADLRGYQVEPVEPAGLAYALDQAWGLAALSRADSLASSHCGSGRFGLIGTSPPMRRLYAEIERAAETDLSVLITGETGTGKELVARALHARSARAAGPFVAVNCAAIPAELVQSELFGVVKGAYTGAATSNSGLIRTAQGGVLLLDEIGEMPLASQASLLRFLDDRIVTAVGGRQSEAVDVTVLAATNRDLEDEVREGRFRQDLLYRLDLLSIRTPPLRDRPSDIEALAEHFLRAEAQSLPRRLRGLSDDAPDWLRAQLWPGNVRQLRSCLIQAGLQCNGGRITAADLSRVRPASGASGQSLDQAVQRVQRDTLRQLLARNRGNVSKTARDLGVSRMTLYRLMARHDIARP